VRAGKAALIIKAVLPIGLKQVVKAAIAPGLPDINAIALLHKGLFNLRLSGRKQNFLDKSHFYARLSPNLSQLIIVNHYKYMTLTQLL
jgi:hypothetical protein